MRKKLTALMLIVVLSCNALAPAYAHNNYGHYRDMSRVLFGTTFPFENRSPLKYPDQHRAIWAFRFVYQIAVDQCNGNNTKTLERLKTLCQVPDMPESISEINLPNVNAVTHRKYTHMGWRNNDYRNLGADWSSRWKIRKGMILKTAKHVFKSNCNKTQRDALCAILYYVHLLGDHIAFSHGTYIKEVSSMLPLHGSIPTGDYGIPCVQCNIISELIHYCYVLFGKDAEPLIRKLTSISERLANLPVDSKGYVTAEAFPRYTELAKEVLDKLEDDIPALLNKQKWWTDVFPTPQ